MGNRIRKIINILFGAGTSVSDIATEVLKKFPRTNPKIIKAELKKLIRATDRRIDTMQNQGILEEDIHKYLPERYSKNVVNRRIKDRKTQEELNEEIENIKSLTSSISEEELNDKLKKIEAIDLNFRNIDQIKKDIKISIQKKLAEYGDDLSAEQKLNAKETAKAFGENSEKFFEDAGVLYYDGSDWEDKTSQEIIEQVTSIELRVDSLTKEIKVAQANLNSAKQRGTHNSCWGYPSPHLSNACVGRYQNILQTKTKVKNKYIDLKTTLEERLKILQAEEELIQELDEAIEIEIDIAGDVHNEAEEIYEQAI